MVNSRILLALTLAFAIVVSSPGICRPVADEVRKPDAIRFGASLDEMKAALANHCSMMHVRVIDPPFLDDVEEVQHQIDCDGLRYMGEPRWAEFVFRDRILEMVWIMVDPDDQEQIIAAMRGAYEGELSNSDYVAFPAARTAWRYEPPEVLFYSDALAPAIEQHFEN